MSKKKRCGEKAPGANGLKVVSFKGDATSKQLNKRLTLTNLRIIQNSGTDVTIQIR